MGILLNACCHIEIDHERDVLDIDTTASKICSNKDVSRAVS